MMTKERCQKLVFRAEQYSKLAERVLDELSKDVSNTSIYEKCIKVTADAEAALYLSQLAVRDLQEGK